MLMFCFINAKILWQNIQKHLDINSHHTNLNNGDNYQTNSDKQISCNACWESQVNEHYSHYSHIKTQHTLFKRNYLNNLTMITVTITWSQCIIQNNILCKYIAMYWIIHKEWLLSYIEKMWQYIYLHITIHVILYSLIYYNIYIYIYIYICICDKIWYCMCKNLLNTYSGAKKYLVSHQLCKFSHLKRWERPVIFIIGIPQLWETK